MKKYLAFIFLFVLIISMFFLQEISSVSNGVLNVFFLGVLPSLGPILLLHNLFINADGVELLLKITRKLGINDLKAYKATIIFLGLMSSSVTLAIYVNAGIHKSYITSKEAQHIVNSFALPSIPFMVALILNKLANPIEKWWIFGLVLVVNLLFYLTFNKRSAQKNINLNDLTPNVKSNIIEESVMASAKTLTLILGTTTIFALLLIPLNFLLTPLNSAITLGFFEYSYSISLLITQVDKIVLLALVAIITFSSLSNILQIKFTCKSISIKDLIKKRSLLTVFNILLTIIVLF